MTNLSPDVTWNFYMKDASIYYNEDMECLMIYSDHSDKVILDGITLSNMKEVFARIGASKLRQTKKEKEAA